MKKEFNGVYNYKTNTILCEEHDMFFWVKKEEITDPNMIYLVNDNSFEDLITDPPIMEDDGDLLDINSVMMFEIKNMSEKIYAKERKRFYEVVDTISYTIRKGGVVDIKLVEEYNKLLEYIA